MRRLLLLALLGLVVAASASGEPSGGAAGKIAYSGGPPPVFLGISVVDADGSGNHALTSGIDNWPVWSADGRQVAWQRTMTCEDCPATVWLANADGAKQHRLTGSREALRPQWSPTARRIAFETKGDIYLVNADGTGMHRLVADSDQPSWSPNGAQIAFSRPAGNRDTPNTTSGIDVVNARGGTVKRLTRGTQPVWSPSGRMILFKRTTASFAEDLYVMDANGRAVRRLARAGFGYGSWSPDSRKVVFACGSQICAVNVTGSVLRRLTHKLWSSEYPAWSPDGKWIAFVSYPKKDAMPGIYVMKANGSGLRKITPYSNDEIPAWQPTRG